MARIEISSVSNPYGTGELQLQGKVAMSGTLTAVTDNLNNASPLKLSTGGVQVASTLQITTNSNPYIDAEDGSGNNRFQVGRDPSSQVVNVDFASNPTGGTNMVGAIRTYTDGVSLSNVMSFRKDGLLTLSNSIAFSNYNQTIATSSIPLSAIYSAFLGNVSFIGDGGGGGIKFLDSGGSAYAKMGFGNLNTTIGQSTYGVVPDLGARLGVRGSGSTSATTSLLVQNSSATDILKITDDGVTTINGFASVTKIGNNNHSSILSVLNTDSTNTTFGFLFKSYSDGGSNRYIELEGYNTTGNIFLGSWAMTNTFSALNGITNAFHSNFSIYQQYSNNVDTGIVFSNNNNSYQTRIWRDGNVSIADSSYNTSASVTSRLFVKGTGSTSGTTSLLVQNSSGNDLLRVQDTGVLTLGTFATGLGKIVVACDPTFGTKTILENNFGGQIIRQQSTDVVIFGGQQIASLTAIGYMGLSAPYIVGNNPIGNTTGSSFDFRVTGSPYAQTPSTPSRGVLFDGGLNFQSGGYANYFELSPTYTFDISNNRIVKGIYYNPTLVTPNTNDKHYGIQTTSGGAYINTTTPQDSACLQADSTTQGFLPPRMTDAEIRAIVSPTNGLIAYNTDINHLCCYQAGAWVKLSHSPM